MELIYDPDQELSSDDFRRLFPDAGDLPTFRFSDDDLAHRYSIEYNRCVFDDDTASCVFCHRADH